MVHQTTFLLYDHVKPTKFTQEYLDPKKYFQATISSLQERLCGGGWEVEKARLVTRVEKQERELRKAIEEREVIEHHHDLTKKEVTKSKVEHYNLMLAK